MAADPLGDALAPLIDGLERLLALGRYLHPGLLPQIVEKAAEKEAPLLAAAAAFRAGGHPHQAGIETSFDLAARAFAALREAPNDPEGIFAAYRAMRYVPYAMEQLYPVWRTSPAVSGFFLAPEAREDAALAARLAAAPERPGTGVIHVDNKRDEKGGYSLYIPEHVDADAALPAIVALHGGTGHGRAFLWTWLPFARARDVALISPTSMGDTWSLMDPPVDTGNIRTLLERVAGDRAIDRERLLMTGMSDGGTFTYLSGFRDDAPFSHLAPVSASFHPMMLQMVEGARVAGRRVYITHGAQDWMFDVDVARTANEMLSSMGAEVVYRELADLAHTYPREENARIIDWLLGTT